MDKYQALHSFWSSFGLTAYDENSVPSDAELPYLTYETAFSTFDYSSAASASLWYRSSSWSAITQKSKTIENALGLGGKSISCDDGLVWIKPGSPLTRRSSDEDESIRRIIINVEIEYTMR